MFKVTEPKRPMQEAAERAGIPQGGLNVCPSCKTNLDKLRKDLKSGPGTPEFAVAAQKFIDCPECRRHVAVNADLMWALAKSQGYLEAIATERRARKRICERVIEAIHIDPICARDGTSSEDRSGEELDLKNKITRIFQEYGKL